MLNVLSGTNSLLSVFLYEREVTIMNPMNPNGTPLLHVNLTTEEVTLHRISEREKRQYIGGTGLGAHFLFTNLSAGVDPLGPDNLLLFFTGPFSGTPVPCSGRTSVMAKSPLTGIWGESDVGGLFGRHLRQLGFFGIVIEGKASSLRYLVVTENGAAIKDAGELQGKDTYETHSLLRQYNGSSSSTMSIGEAGERLVPLAAIVSDGKDGRIAARGGLGAVMGSKRLKAVVITKREGSRPSASQLVPIADKADLTSSIRESVKTIMANSEALQLDGTSGGVMACHYLEDFPLKNWQLRQWPAVEPLDGTHMTETILSSRYHCANCPIGCGRVVQVSSGPYATPDKAAGPEYETMGSLGGNLMINDLEAVAKANDLCNRYGMDTISVGQVLGFAFEAFERGYLTETETGGLPLSWGDGEAVVKLIHLMGKREGFGEVLGLGVRGACESLNIDDPELQMHVKGMELPSHDPRAFVSIALGYATSPRGACHLQAYSHGLEAWYTLEELGFPEIVDRYSLDRKAELTAVMQNLMSVFDSLKLCKFLLPGGLKIATVVRWLNDITGWDYTREELLTAGERIFNLKRLFNTREGISSADDTLPRRFTTGPGGKHLKRLLAEYYQLRGWSETGIPTSETVERLGLSEIV